MPILSKLAHHPITTQAVAHLSLAKLAELAGLAAYVLLTLAKR